MSRYVWIDCSEDSQPMEIFKFIQSKRAVTESDIKKEFHYSVHSSITHFLRVCVKYYALTKVGDYYHQDFSSIYQDDKYDEAEKEERIEEIKNKLVELGLE